MSKNSSEVKNIRTVWVCFAFRKLYHFRRELYLFELLLALEDVFKIAVAHDSNKTSSRDEKQTPTRLKDGWNFIVQKLYIPCTTLELTSSRNICFSSSEQPLSWIIFICLTIVDLPHSPAPNSKSLISFNKFFCAFDVKRTQ